MEVSKIIFLSKWMICRFHVNLRGCTWRTFFSMRFNPKQLSNYHVLIQNLGVASNHSSYCWWRGNPTPPGMFLKPVVNNGISTTNLNWCKRRISAITPHMAIFASSSNSLPIHLWRQIRITKRRDPHKNYPTDPYLSVFHTASASNLCFLSPDHRHLLLTWARFAPELVMLQGVDLQHGPKNGFEPQKISETSYG